MTADGRASAEAGGASGRTEVLMVEDNPGDVRLAEEAFADLDRPVSLTVAGDGEAALDRLLSVDRALPSLVLLDMDLPDVDGRAVLDRLKADEDVRHVPIVVFSSSNDPADVRDSYDRHANAFMTKPRDADQFFRTVRRLAAFWFSAATLAGGEPR